MTHPERSRPIRDRKGYRGPSRAAVRQAAARITELDALAALYAEQHGDTPALQAERRDALTAEIGGRYGAAVGSTATAAWDAAITGALAELRGTA